MKKFIFLLFLFFIAGKAYTQVSKNDFIEFCNGGDGVKYTRPLLVTKEKVEFGLEPSDTIEFQGLQALNHNFTKNDFFRQRYLTIIIDKESYEKLIKFIFIHIEYCANDVDRINPAGYDEIIARNQTFALFYKTERTYFRELRSYLIDNKCDAMLIKELEDRYPYYYR